MDLRSFLQSLLLIGAVAAAPSLERFRRSSNGTSPQARIIGGEPVRPGELPYVCGVVQDNNLHCGCSIIAPNYALTSASCATALPGGNEGVKLVAGDLRADEGISFPVLSIVTHPQYDATTNDYDIAILETSDAIVGPNIQPVLLAVAGTILRDGIQYTVSGWGATVPNGPQNPVLAKANVYKVPDVLCIQDYAAVQKVITPRMVCSAAPGKDICQGDNGGPLVYQHRIHVDDTPSLGDAQVGVASFGNGCGDPAFPGVYTRVSDPDVRAFITAIAKV